MKKYLSLILVLAVLIAVIPMTVQAVNNDAEREEVIQKACEAFPEFKSKILAPDVQTDFYSAGEPELVYTETRFTSDRECVAYTEFSDGSIFLDVGEFEYTYSTNSTLENSTEIEFDITIKATRKGNAAYLKISNLRFTLNKFDYDTIDSIGTVKPVNPEITYNDECTYVGESHRSAETASQKAYVAYKITYTYTPKPGYEDASWLRFELGNNSWKITHKCRQGDNECT